MPAILFPSSTAGAKLLPRFCRGCGYDLRASTDQCPDCGRRFDAGNRKTFASRPPRGIVPWVRRLALLVVVVVLAGYAALLFLRHGWMDEQQRLADLLRRTEDAPVSTGFETEPLSPWLRARLPEALGKYLDRTTGVEIYRSSNFSDDDLNELCGLTHLRSLTLRAYSITDAGLPHLTKLTRLEDLYLSMNSISDKGLTRLQPMPALRSLQIEGGAITNAGLQNLPEMPRLRELQVYENHVDGDGLRRYFHEHPSVHVDGDGVNDTPPARELKPLPIQSVEGR